MCLRRRGLQFCRRGLRAASQCFSELAALPFQAADAPLLMDVSAMHVQTCCSDALILVLLSNQFNLKRHCVVVEVVEMIILLSSYRLQELGAQDHNTLSSR